MVAVVGAMAEAEAVIGWWWQEQMRGEDVREEGGEEWRAGALLPAGQLVNCSSRWVQEPTCASFGMEYLERPSQKDDGSAHASTAMEDAGQRPWGEAVDFKGRRRGLRWPMGWA